MVWITGRAAARRDPSHLASLASGLRERAALRGGTIADLVEAVQLHQAATAALAGSQELPGQLANLGMSLHGLAARTTDVALYREAIDVFARAVQLGLSVSPAEALRAGLAWQAMAADTVADWPQVVTAGDGALRALWVLLAGQMLRSGKESWLRTCTGVAASTAAAHRVVGEPRAAVAALDSGRALLLDGPLPVATRLAARHPELARRYRAASAAFTAAAGAREDIARLRPPMTCAAGRTVRSWSLAVGRRTLRTGLVGRRRATASAACGWPSCPKRSRSPRRGARGPSRP